MWLGGKPQQAGSSPGTGLEASEMSPLPRPPGTPTGDPDVDLSVSTDPKHKDRTRVTSSCFDVVQCRPSRKAGRGGSCSWSVIGDECLPVMFSPKFIKR